MPENEIQNPNCHIVYEAKKSQLLTVAPLAEYASNNRKGENCWHIQYHKTTPLTHPEEEVFDPFVVLGAIISNYQVRFQIIGNETSHKDPSQAKKIGEKQLLRPEKAMSIVWNGVDLKAVFGQDHFVKPASRLSQEQLRQTGLDAQQKIDAWVANGGLTTGTAQETLESLQNNDGAEAK